MTWGPVREHLLAHGDQGERTYCDMETSEIAPIVTWGTVREHLL